MTLGFFTTDLSFPLAYMSKSILAPFVDIGWGVYPAVLLVVGGTKDIPIVVCGTEDNLLIVTFDLWGKLVKVIFGY